MLALKLFFRKLFNRKRPLFLFSTNGLSQDGRIELEMEWNDAFMKHIRSEGFIGHTEEECVEMFMMCFTKQPEDPEGEDRVTSDAHPHLQPSNSGNQVRR